MFAFILGLKVCLAVHHTEVDRDNQDIVIEIESSEMKFYLKLKCN